MQKSRARGSGVTKWSFWMPGFKEYKSQIEIVCEMVVMQLIISSAPILSIQLLHTSLLSNSWELDHRKFSSCLFPHTTHLHGVHVLYNLTIVQSSWKTILFGKSLQSYIKIWDFDNAKNTVQERSMILLGFFSSYCSFSLPPSCCLYLLGALQSKVRCYTAWFSFKNNYRKRKNKEWTGNVSYLY